MKSGFKVNVFWFNLEVNAEELAAFEKLRAELGCEVEHTVLNKFAHSLPLADGNGKEEFCVAFQKDPGGFMRGSRRYTYSHWGFFGQRRHCPPDPHRLIFVVRVKDSQMVNQYIAGLKRTLALEPNPFGPAPRAKTKKKRERKQRVFGARTSFASC